jgi:GT2 family glycosyltransferase
MEIVKEKSNLGFCEGNNVGIRIAKGRYVVFLNNDTYVESNWLEELAKRAELDDEPAVVASMMVYPKSSFTSLGIMYDVYGASLAKEGSGSDSENQELFYGSGAALLVCKNVLNEVGAFDPALFMYQDEVDLCWRIRLAGYKISYARNARCYHLKPAADAIGENLNMPVWKFYHAHGKNRIRVLVKNYSNRNILKRLPATIILISLRTLLLMTLRRRSQYFTATLKGFIWNLSNIRDTIAHRYEVQRLRKTGDCDIQRFMIDHSIELSLWSRVAHRGMLTAEALALRM